MPTAQEQLGMDFITQVEGLFGLTAQKTKTFVESLVTANSNTLRTEILSEIDVNEGELTVWKATMEAFKTAVDKADLTEDGQINLEASIMSIFQKIGATETDIATLKPKVTALETALNAEVANRVSLGESLTTLINNAKSTLQSAIDTLASRVTALEARMTSVEGVAGSAKEWIDGVKSKATGLADRVTATLNTAYGIA